MDNGEVMLLSGWDSGESAKGFIGNVCNVKPVVTFSRDRGESWTPLAKIEGGEGRLVVLAYLGKGNLMFQTDLLSPVMQYFSSDYGRTWPDRMPLQPAANGGSMDGKGKMLGFFGTEGNPLVDRDGGGSCHEDRKNWLELQPRRPVAV
jgi:hypothetical protein